MKKLLIPLFISVFTFPALAIDAFSVIIEIPGSSTTFQSLREYKSDNTVTDMWKATNGKSYLDSKEDGEPISTYGWKYDGKKFIHYEIDVPSLTQEGKYYSYNPGPYEYIFDFNRNIVKVLKDNVITKKWIILSHNFGNPSKKIGENFIVDSNFTEPTPTSTTELKLINAYVDYLILKNLNDRYGSYSDMDDIKKLMRSIQQFYENILDTNIDNLWDKAVNEYEREYGENITTFASFYSTQGEGLYKLVLLGFNQQANEVGASSSDVEKDF